jgi:hypothetical protein
VHSSAAVGSSIGSQFRFGFGNLESHMSWLLSCQTLVGAQGSHHQFEQLSEGKWHLVRRHAAEIA